MLWHAASAEEEEIYLRVLVKTFSDLGYVEGKNVHLDHRFPAENPERFQILARELVEEKPDAIIAVTWLGAAEFKKATATIPVVFVLVNDPVAFGFAQSLNRPGGNMTGPSLMTLDLSGKRLELFKAAAPHLSRIAILTDVTDPFRDRIVKAYQASGERLGISLWPVLISKPDDIEPLFEKIASDQANGVVRGTGSMLFVERARIGAASLAHRLPMMTYIAEEVTHGSLLSYGQDLPDFFRRAVTYVDKILKGTKPAELPIEQPTKLKLVLNAKSAKTLGLSFPPTLNVSADEVIE